MTAGSNHFSRFRANVRFWHKADIETALRKIHAVVYLNILRAARAIQLAKDRAQNE